MCVSFSVGWRRTQGAVVGRVLVWRGPHEHRIVDVAIVASRQGAGIGTDVLRSLAADAAGESKPLRLTVAADNQRARRLYSRLGFREVGADLVDVSMEIPSVERQL